MNLRLIFLLLALSAAWVSAADQPATVGRPPAGVPNGASQFKGKWYYVYMEKTKIPWHAAKQRCEVLGGQLAITADKETWDFVHGLINKAHESAPFTGAGVWLGATRENAQGQWQWLDGRPFKFTAWNKGKPDNATKKDFYLAVQGGWDDFGENGYWSKSSQIVGFVCEWKGK